MCFLFTMSDIGSVSASRLNFTSRSPPILPEAKASRETQEQTKQIFIGPPGGGES
jgi:hypothetical protein